MRAYCFDDGVLFDLDRARRKAGRVAVEELWARVGSPEAQAVTVDTLLETHAAVAAELVGRVASDPQLTLAGFERLLEDLGVNEPGLAIQVDAVYREHRDRVAEPFPDADIVRSLRERYRVGLVASGEVEWRRIGDLDTVLHPAASGLDRADPRVLEKVATRLDVPLDEMTVVTTPGSALARSATKAAVSCTLIDRARNESLRGL